MTTAVIFVPADHNELYAAQCSAYCTTMGYEVAGIIQGNWQGVVDILRNELATVVVIARPEHIDPSWEPRVEFVAGAASSKHDNSRSPSLRQRRPHRI